MHCQYCSPSPELPKDNGQLINQESSPSGGLLQTTFYYYDVKKGTQCKLVSTAATVTSCTAGGALGMHLLTSRLFQPGDRGNSLYERAVKQLEGLCPGSSSYIGAALGAALGAAGAIWLIRSAYQDGLKPRTAAAIQSIMNGLIHQVESDYKTIELCKKAVHTGMRELSIRKEEMLAEKARNQARARAVYDQAVQKYEQDAAIVTGELRGYFTEVFDRLTDPARLPTYEEAVSNHMRSGSFQLGQDVARFFERGDFSIHAQKCFLKSLMPYLNERELKNTERIMAKYPKYRPVLWQTAGPLEQEYNKIDSQRQKDQRKMGELEKRVRELTTQYSCFELGPDGKVKPTSVVDFSQYLPD